MKLKRGPRTKNVKETVVQVEKSKTDHQKLHRLVNTHKQKGRGVEGCLLRAQEEVSEASTGNELNNPSIEEAETVKEEEEGEEK